MNDKDKEFSELVGEALGRASVAWSELPSGIFDSDTCSVLYLDIMNAYNNEIKKLQTENERLEAENAELKELINELANNGMDYNIALRLQELEEK